MQKHSFSWEKNKRREEIEKEGEGWEIKKFSRIDTNALHGGGGVCCVVVVVVVNVIYRILFFRSAKDGCSAERRWMFRKKNIKKKKLNLCGEQKRVNPCLSIPESWGRSRYPNRRGNVLSCGLTTPHSPCLGPLSTTQPTLLSSERKDWNEDWGVLNLKPTSDFSHRIDILKRGC